MKKIFKYTLIAMLAFSSIASAGNKFSEGTKRFDLTEVLPPQVIEEMKLYLNNTRERLQEALKKSFGMTHMEATEFLKKEIFELVMGSDGRAELLMRVSLNQAYDLVFGVPDLERDPSGRTPLYPAALDKNINRHLSVSVLRRMISTALEFYQSDYEAVKNGTLTQLPVATYTARRLNQTAEWLPAIMDNETFFQFLIVSCHHVKNVLVDLDRSKVFTAGEYLLKLEELQKSAQQGLMVKDPVQREALIRELNGKFSNLRKGLVNRLTNGRR